MPTQQFTNHKLPAIAQNSGDGDQQLRDLAIKQIERKRHFQMRAFSYGLVAVVVTVIWAISEYNNAGGWPSDGFSQSSSIPHVWNIWVIYPILGLLVALSIDAWSTFGRKPITEREISKEIDRLKGTVRRG